MSKVVKNKNLTHTSLDHSINNISIANIEMFAEINKLFGDFIQIKKNRFIWNNEETGVTICLDFSENVPKIIFEDAFDNFDKVYQIIGYAHYHEYKIECHF